jgi:hypothetical protein
VYLLGWLQTEVPVTSLSQRLNLEKTLEASGLFWGLLPPVLP